MENRRKFTDAHLWAAIEELPYLYSVATARGALTALAGAIERAERGEPNRFVAPDGEPRDRATIERELRAAMPTLCTACPLG